MNQKMNQNDWLEKNNDKYHFQEKQFFNIKFLPIKTFTLVFITIILANIAIAAEYPEVCGAGEDMQVDGKVGIGTTTPNEKLEVRANNASGIGGHISINNLGGGYGTENALSFRHSGIKAQIKSILSTNAYGSGNLVFSTLDPSNSFGERVRITSSGKVGIGTSDPDEQLHVVGNIYTSGYVFATDVITEGPWVDVRAYASFSAAISAIGTDEVTLLIPNTQSVSSDITVPSNVHLYFLRSGSLDTSANITINGPLEAGAWQIFYGSGTIKFLQDSVRAEWWGFDTTSAGAINAAAIQSAISSFITRDLYGELGGTVLLGRGIFTVAPDVITFLNKSNVTLKGAGSSYGYDATYYAPTILKFTSGSIGINISDPESTVRTNYNAIKDLMVDGDGVLATGIQISNAQLIDGVAVSQCTSAGLRLKNATNASHIDKCSFYNNGGAGVYVDSSGGLSYTTVFTMRRTNIRANATGLYAEIGFSVKISDCVIESNYGYGLHLYLPDGTNGIKQWTFDKVYFENNGKGGSQVYAIRTETEFNNQTGGPPAYIVFRDCKIHSGSATQRYVDIDDGKHIKFENCTFVASTEALSHRFTYYSDNISYVTNDIATGAPTDAQLATGRNCQVRCFNTSLITDHGVTDMTYSGTPITLFTMSGRPAMYMVFAYLTVGGASTDYANARIAWDGTTASVMGIDNAGYLTITISGTNVQATQTSGAPQIAGISWKYMIIR